MAVWKRRSAASLGLFSGALLNADVRRLGAFFDLEVAVCRNIKTLFNFEPPATDEEIQASALQFVRKLSGFNKPSKANEVAFDLAVEQVTEVARTLIHSLVTPRDAVDWSQA